MNWVITELEGILKKRLTARQSEAVQEAILTVKRSLDMETALSVLIKPLVENKIENHVGEYHPYED